MPGISPHLNRGQEPHEERNPNPKRSSCGLVPFPSDLTNQEYIQIDTCRRFLYYEVPMNPRRPTTLADIARELESLPLLYLKHFAERSILALKRAAVSPKKLRK